MADRPVLLTRPLEQSRTTAEALQAHGIASLIWPVTRIVPAIATLDIPEGTDALLFTSANGVRAFAGLTSRRDLPALCVGEATAAAARDAGLTDIHAADGNAAALARLALASPHRRFLHPRGSDVAGDLAGALTGAGREVRQAVVYRAEETGPPSAEIARALASGGIAAATAWSPRGARLIGRYLAGDGRDADLTATVLVAISQAAAAPLTDSGFASIRIADSRSIQGMITAISGVFPGKPG